MVLETSGSDVWYVGRLAWRYEVLAFEAMQIIGIGTHHWKSCHCDLAGHLQECRGAPESAPRTAFGHRVGLPKSAPRSAFSARQEAQNTLKAVLRALFGALQARWPKALLGALVGALSALGAPVNSRLNHRLIMSARHIQSASPTS